MITWRCIPCGAGNLDRFPVCGVCHAERPRPSMFREAVEALEACQATTTLEDYLCRHAATNVLTHALRIRRCEPDGVVISIQPAGAAGDPISFLVDENDLTPCVGNVRA